MWLLLQCCWCCVRCAAACNAVGALLLLAFLPPAHMSWRARPALALSAWLLVAAVVSEQAVWLLHVMRLLLVLTAHAMKACGVVSFTGDWCTDCTLLPSAHVSCRARPALALSDMALVVAAAMLLRALRCCLQCCWGVNAACVSATSSYELADTACACIECSGPWLLLW